MRVKIRLILLTAVDIREVVFSIRFCVTGREKMKISVRKSGYCRE